MKRLRYAVYFAGSFFIISGFGDVILIDFFNNVIDSILLFYNFSRFDFWKVSKKLLIQEI